MANIALHGMEYEIKDALEQQLLWYLKLRNKGYTSRAVARQNLSLVRYADDFVIMHKSKELIEEAKKFIQQWLGRMGLELSESKTKIVNIFHSN